MDCDVNATIALSHTSPLLYSYYQAHRGMAYVIPTKINVHSIWRGLCTLTQAPLKMYIVLTQGTEKLQYLLHKFTKYN